MVKKYAFTASQKLGWHHHPVMNYGVLVQGELTIIDKDGTEKVVRGRSRCRDSRHRPPRQEPSPQIRHSLHVLPLAGRPAAVDATPGDGGVV